MVLKPMIQVNKQNFLYKFIEKNRSFFWKYFCQIEMNVDLVCLFLLRSKDIYFRMCRAKTNETKFNMCILLQLKYPIYRDWVKNLNTQNIDLIETVEELEKEACQRLELLEKKLKDSKDLNKIRRLDSDVRSLIALIRRAIGNERTWSTDGLTFFEIDLQDIFGK